jgi:hypothetical protein
MHRHCEGAIVSSYDEAGAFSYFRLNAYRCCPGVVESALALEIGKVAEREACVGGCCGCCGNLNAEAQSEGCESKYKQLEIADYGAEDRDNTPIKICQGTINDRWTEPHCAGIGEWDLR